MADIKEPKKLTLLQKLEQQARARKLEKHSEESIAWFQKNARLSVGREQAQTLLKKEQKKYTGYIGTETAIGKMFTYSYDAKHKDTLPYWDRFPLIFYVGPALGGFYGINLHYLSPRLRAVLFDALLDLKNSTKYTAKTKLKLTWNLLNSSKEYKLFKPCFKHYLAGQLESRIIPIPYEEWEAALFLPTADFQGASNNKVWSDSMLSIK